jgi:hypothetical protein
MRRSILERELRKPDWNSFEEAPYARAIGSFAVVKAGWENSSGDLAIRVETISLDSLCLHFRFLPWKRSDIAMGPPI